MSEIKYPTITIRTKDKSKPPAGYNTEVLLDGKPVPFCKSASLTVDARGMTVVKLEMYAHAEVNVISDVATKVIPLKDIRKEEGELS